TTATAATGSSNGRGAVLEESATGEEGLALSAGWLATYNSAAVSVAASDDINHLIESMGGGAELDHLMFVPALTSGTVPHPAVQSGYGGHRGTAATGFDVSSSGHLVPGASRIGPSSGAGLAFRGKRLMMAATGGGSTSSSQQNSTAQFPYAPATNVSTGGNQRSQRQRNIFAAMVAAVRASASATGTAGGGSSGAAGVTAAAMTAAAMAFYSGGSSCDMVWNGADCGSSTGTPSTLTRQASYTTVLDSRNPVSPQPSMASYHLKSTAGPSASFPSRPQSQRQSQPQLSQLLLKTPSSAAAADPADVTSAAAAAANTTATTAASGGASAVASCQGACTAGKDAV
ncbi:hypothetical protein Vretifemale_17111, partial [Volvox reticuliferus]